MNITSYHALTSCRQPDKATPGNQEGMRQGWQPPLQRMWGASRGNQEGKRRKVFELLEMP